MKCTTACILDLCSAQLCYCCWKSSWSHHFGAEVQFTTVNVKNASFSTCCAVHHAKMIGKLLLCLLCFLVVYKSQAKTKALIQLQKQIVLSHDTLIYLRNWQPRRELYSLILKVTSFRRRWTFVQACWLLLVCLESFTIWCSTNQSNERNTVRFMRAHDVLYKLIIQNLHSLQPLKPIRKTISISTKNFLTAIQHSVISPCTYTWWAGMVVVMLNFGFSNCL